MFQGVKIVQRLKAKLIKAITAIFGKAVIKELNQAAMSLIPDSRALSLTEIFVPLNFLSLLRSMFSLERKVLK
jgi:hypothetical protein